MKALIYKEKNAIKLCDAPMPKLENETDAIVKITLSAICTSDLHIIKGYVPNAKANTILGHEFVGEVVDAGKKVRNLKIGDRVAANCISFCGECYFCKQGFINNCQNGGWELGCKINGGQAEYARIPYADTSLSIIPENVSDESALFVGDILSSGYFGAELSEIKPNDTVAVIGSGPVGLCAMSCARLFNAKKIIAIDISDTRLSIAKEQNLADVTLNPNNVNIVEEINKLTDARGADAVIECAGTPDSFETAWKIARPNSVVAVVAMYEETQLLPLPKMYGKNLIFKTGGVDAIHCDKLLKYISEGKINTNFLISKTMPLEKIEEAYKIFENKDERMLKIAIKI